MGNKETCIMCGCLLEEIDLSYRICARCRVHHEQDKVVRETLEEKPQPSAAEKIKATILLIDDEPNILKMIGSRLRSNGYHVITASDGTEGFDMIKEEHPDLIITDILMPKMTGYDLLQLLKKQTDGTEEIPVIVMTARGSMKSFFSDWEIHAFLEKPIDSVKLLELISHLLSKRNKG